MRHLVLVAVGTVAALWVGQEILRSGLLASVGASPSLRFYGSVLPPLLAAALYAASRATRLVDLLCVAAVAGGSSLLYEFAAASLNHPLHGSSWVRLHPAWFWTAGPAGYFLVWLIAIGALRLPFAWPGKRSPGSAQHRTAVDDRPS